MGRSPKDSTQKRVPAVSVLERRLANPESINEGSTFIPLKDDPDGKAWKERWGNFGQQGRYGELIHRKGWEQVRREELLSAESVPDMVDKGDGLVWRGEKGKECLLKMPLRAFNEIKHREAQSKLARMRSQSHMKHAIAEAGAKQYGDRAGDELLQMTGEVRELPPERYDVEELINAPSGQEA